MRRGTALGFALVLGVRFIIWQCVAGFRARVVSRWLLFGVAALRSITLVIEQALLVISSWLFVGIIRTWRGTVFRSLAFFAGFLLLRFLGLRFAVDLRQQGLDLFAQTLFQQQE